ncbi:hypothetical protein CSDA_0300, partial [Streptococcus dysgalactiae]
RRKNRFLRPQLNLKQ